MSVGAAYRCRSCTYYATLESGGWFLCRCVKWNPQSDPYEYTGRHAVETNAATRITMETTTARKAIPEAGCSQMTQGLSLAGMIAANVESFCMAEETMERVQEVSTQVFGEVR